MLLLAFKSVKDKILFLPIIFSHRWYESIGSIRMTTPITTAVKDLESDTFDTSALITWLQNRTLPVNDPTAFLKPIITIPVTTQVATEIPEAVTPVATEHLAPDRTITGKTTFQELLDCGVTNESTQTIVDEPITEYTMIIKDYSVRKGFTFSDIKTILQTEVDDLPKLTGFNKPKSISK
jgi:hypothetical protein